MTRHDPGLAAKLYAKAPSKLEATLDGWTLLRFTGAMIQSGEALQKIEQALMQEGG